MKWQSAGFSQIGTEIWNIPDWSLYKRVSGDYDSWDSATAIKFGVPYICVFIIVLFQLTGVQEGSS